MKSKWNLLGKLVIISIFLLIMISVHELYIGRGDFFIFDLVFWSLHILYVLLAIGVGLVMEWRRFLAVCQRKVTFHPVIIPISVVLIAGLIPTPYWIIWMGANALSTAAYSPFITSLATVIATILVVRALTDEG